MPTYEITSPDGGVYEVTAPEGASEEEILSYAQQNFAPETTDTLYAKTDPLASYTWGGADMASYGFDADLRGFGRALGSKFRGDERPLTELIDLGREELRQEHSIAQQDNPVAYGAGQLTAGVGGAYAPARALSSVDKVAKYARANPLKTAAATSGIQGSIYGFGSGEGSAGERAQNAFAVGLPSAALGPAFARVGQGVGSLLDRAARLTAPKLPVQTATREIAESSNGEILPMTGGQLSQDPTKQALEVGARKGAYGQRAQQTIMNADNTQQNAIRGVMDDLGGEGGDLLDAGRMTQQAYKSQKNRVSQAYDKADIINDVYVNKAPIQETFVPQVKNRLNQYNLDTSDLSEQGRKLVKDLDFLKGEKVTAVNLAKLEKWRGKASNIIANNNQLKGSATEGAAFKQIVDDYDRFMAKLPEDALKSGDEDALQAILKARGERRKQGILFERDKTIKKIVQSQDLTDEELANMVLSGSARSEKINAGSGRLVKNLKKAVGDKAPELQAGLKRGTLARMLQRSTSTTEGENALRTIDPAKLRKEFDNLTSNRTFLKEVFEDSEIETIDAIHRDLVKIASEQPGTNNYSNTAYALMRFAGIVPFGRAAVGDALQGLGDRAATKDIRKGLSPVLQDMIDQLTAERRFYGAAAAPSIAEDLSE